MANKRHITAVRRAAAKRSAEVRAAPPCAKLRVRADAVDAARAAARRAGESLVDWASDALLAASRRP